MPQRCPRSETFCMRSWNTTNKKNAYLNIICPIITKGNYQDKNQEISSIKSHTHHLAGTLNNPNTLQNE